MANVSAIHYVENAGVLRHVEGANGVDAIKLAESAWNEYQSAQSIMDMDVI